MKQLKFILIVVAVAMAYNCPAQMMPRHAISAGGGNYESAMIQLSYTIGQSEPVETFAYPSITFHGGFQQFVFIPVSVPEQEQECEILLYPNPCTNRVVLDVEMSGLTELSYLLYDTEASLLATKTLKVGNDRLQETISMESMPPGIYNLKLLIIDKDSWNVHSIKIIKR